jgi:hypothetical protein
MGLYLQATIFKSLKKIIEKYASVSLFSWVYADKRPFFKVFKSLLLF